MREITIQTEEDLTSYFVPGNASLDKLPVDVRRQLYPVEEDAFRRGTSYFAQLSGQSTLKPLCALLERIGEIADTDMTLEIHISTSTYLRSDRIFRFASLDTPWIGLPWFPPPDQLPPILQHVYQIVGRTGDFRSTGGLARFERIRSLADIYGPMRREFSEAYAVSYPFYRSQFGDQLCFTPEDHAVWLGHETLRISDAGPLSDLIRTHIAEMMLGEFSPVHRCDDSS